MLRSIVNALLAVGALAATVTSPACAQQTAASVLARSHFYGSVDGIRSSPFGSDNNHATGFTNQQQISAARTPFQNRANQDRIPGNDNNPLAASSGNWPYFYGDVQGLRKE